MKHEHCLQLSNLNSVLLLDLYIGEITSPKFLKEVKQNGKNIFKGRNVLC